MSKRVVIDPITRIEGHLRIEVEVDENNVINKAWSSSTCLSLVDGPCMACSVHVMDFKGQALSEFRVSPNGQ